MTRHWAEVFVEELRTRAAQMKAYGDTRGEEILELHAREIEQRRAAYEDEELSASQGAAEGGYSANMLRELRKKKQWSGRRRDLPRRPRAVTGLSMVDAGGRTDNKTSSIAERVLRSHPGGSRRRSASR